MIFSTERTGFLDEGRRGAGQPAVGNRLFQRLGCDFRHLDEDGGISVEVRDREEGARIRGEHRLFLAEILDANGQDGAVGRALVLEPPDVRLAERPFPGEGLTADEPCPVAVPLILRDLGQLRDHPGHVIEGRHLRTVLRSGLSGPFASLS
jgi:hypothetical protein